MRDRLHVLAAAAFVWSSIELIQADEKPSATPKAITASGNESVRHEDIPRWVVDLFSAKKLDAQYEFATALSPVYLSADFDGDGKIDVAVLVKQRTTGKLGIAIFHGATGKATILGAGTPLGNGGDDFSWMDTWQVYSKTRGLHAAGERNAPALRADALLVGKTEAASALIYWNGKRYVWLQQGD